MYGKIAHILAFRDAVAFERKQSRCEPCMRDSFDQYCDLLGWRYIFISRVAAGSWHFKCFSVGSNKLCEICTTVHTPKLHCSNHQFFSSLALMERTIPSIQMKLSVARKAFGKKDFLATHVNSRLRMLTSIS